MGLFFKLLTMYVLFMGVLWVLVASPNTPIPNVYNPTAALDPLAHPNFLTKYKLGRTSMSGELCRAALKSASVRFYELPNKTQGDQCGIENQTRLVKLSNATVSDLDTRCDIALRLLMWETHSVQPAAQDLFGQSVSRINHLGSYSCRAMRTSSGRSSRMSEHATANAVDIRGFTLEDGKKISLISGWAGSENEQKFLRRVRDGSCDYFNTTLSPDYNALHSDHFHFDLGRWNSCR